jgi:dihydroflavonol-4-reductase
MKILVTGATGFVGSHVARKLLKAGHQIRVLRRKESSTKMLAGLNVETAIGDVTDRHSVFEAVKGCEAVFHVAGFVSFWRGHNETMKRIHVDGTRNVVEACLAHRVKRLVQTSSIAAIGYETGGKPATEETPFNWWPYRIEYFNTKHLAEEEVREGIKKGLDAVIVNPAVIFGAGDLNLNAGAMVFQAARRKILVCPKGGCCTCDIEDVAEGHLLALEKGRTGERYILGGNNYTFKELFILIAEVVGVPPPKAELPKAVLLPLGHLWDLVSRFNQKEPMLTPESVRVSTIPCYYSSEKAIRELGYKISPFRETIRKTYEWYLQNGYLKRVSS